MPQCADCAIQLQPAAPNPHTNYVTTLYRIGGRLYCRHHAIRAAVAAGAIDEIKRGSIPLGS